MTPEKKNSMERAVKIALAAILKREPQMRLALESPAAKNQKRPNPMHHKPAPKKGAIKALSATGQHQLNLRCTKCDYAAKVTTGMLKKARLKCPIDGTILRTRDERGETRGRMHSQAA